MYWNFIKKLLLVLGGIASIVAIISFFWSTPFYKERKIKLECHTERMLSFGTKVDSLIVQYNGKRIDDVWKIRVILNNAGMQSIIGSGSSSVLLNDQLILNINSSYQIISYTVNQNDFGAKYKQTNNTFTISFKKWKPNEKMQIEVLLTPIKNNDKVYPSISVNERDVIGADVIFHNLDLAKIEDSSNNLDWLINLKSNYPSFLFKIAKYLGIIIFSMLFFTPIYLIIKFIQGKIKYSKWKKRYWKSFLKELENSQIPKEERQKYKHKPYEVPKEYHSQFTNIPEIPDPDSIAMLIFMLSFSVLMFCPFVVYAFFAWYNL